jgi:hypothetical protein
MEQNPVKAISAFCRYLRVLGSGAHGIVWYVDFCRLHVLTLFNSEVEEVQSRERRAVKKVNNFRNIIDGKRLLREVRILRTLSHPNV